MKKLSWIFIYACLSLTSFTLAASDWILIAPGKGADYQILTAGNDAFTVRINGNGESAAAGVQSCLTVNNQVGLPAIIKFQARVSGKEKATLSPLLSIKADGKAPATYGPAAELNPGEWRPLEFSLVRDFKLTGETAHLWQIKLGVKCAIALNETVVFDVKDFSITSGEVAAATAPSVKPKQWILIAHAKGGSYDLTSSDTKSFTVDLKRNDVDAPARVQSCLDINQNVHSQNKLAFSYRLTGNKPVVIQPMLSYADNGKTVMGFGHKINVTEREFKDMALPLDATFRLSDAPYFIRQLKFSFDISGSSAGTEAGVEIKNIRFASSSDLSVSSGGIKVKIMPPRKITSVAPPDAVKVYFSFDNEDFATIFEGRGRYPRTPDHFQYPGFRDMLIETVRNQLALAITINDADIIVYSRARPNAAEAQAIAAKVVTGTPLIAFARIADPEVAALLPAHVQPISDNGIPQRQILRAVNADDPLFSGLNKAKFGVYNKVTPKNDATVRLCYADGSAVVIGKDKILYSSLTVGADLIPGKTAHDPFLLRAIAELTGKSVDEKNLSQTIVRDGYMPGAGDQNFGRFGYLIGDGLLTENMSNTFCVTNGSQEYGFSSRVSPKIPFEKWNFKSAAANDGNASRVIHWFYKWPEVGMVELDATCFIPADWRDRNVYFSAPEGIDDTAEVFFNDVSIGKVTANMPNYWMTPHKYLIKPELIKFGGMNHIRVESENLRGSGGFGACPELLCDTGENSKPLQFTVDRINWLGKGGVITEPDGKHWRFDTSLAFPGIRWEFFTKRIDMALYHLAEFASYIKDGNYVTVNLTQSNTIPSDWSEPWLLLHRTGNTRPLLLVFSRRPESIEVKRSGGTVNGLSLAGAGTVRSEEHTSELQSQA